MSMFRTLQHLLPTGWPWRTTFDTLLRRWLTGISRSQDDAVAYLDDIYDDLDPARTRLLAQWERQFGLYGLGSTQDRIAALEAEWASTGGQSPRYIHDVLRLAGFDVCISEWWTTETSPRTPFDPRLVANNPAIGSYQCDAVLATQPQCIALLTSTLADPQPQCNRTFANETNYLVNKTLQNVAPPPLPNDPALWPYFFYVGGAPGMPTIPAVMDDARRAEFERLLLKLSPAHQWIVTNIDWVTTPDFLTPAPDRFRWTARGQPGGALTSWEGLSGGGQFAGSATVDVHGLAGAPGVELGTGRLVAEGSDAQPMLDLMTGELTPIALLFARPPGVASGVATLVEAGDALTGNTFRIELNYGTGLVTVQPSGLTVAQTIRDDGNAHTVVLDRAGVLYVDGVASSPGASVTVPSFQSVWLGDGVTDAGVVGAFDVLPVVGFDAAAWRAFALEAYGLAMPRQEDIAVTWRADSTSDGAVSSWPSAVGGFDTSGNFTGPDVLTTLAGATAPVGLASTPRSVSFAAAQAGLSVPVAASSRLRHAFNFNYTVVWMGRRSAAALASGSPQRVWEANRTSYYRVSADFLGSNAVVYDVFGRGSTNLPGVPVDTEWHAYAVVFESNIHGCALFVDGAFRSRGYWPDVDDVADATSFRLGAASASGWGDLGEIVVYDALLSDDDIARATQRLIQRHSSCDVGSAPSGSALSTFPLILQHRP